MSGNGTGARRKKLVLHFDIRNTVLVADSVTNVSVEGALNSYLTSVAWGRVDDDGDWNLISPKPSLDRPADDAITYYKYHEAKAIRSPEDRLGFRKSSGDFTASQHGRCFQAHFESHLRLLEYGFEPSDPSLSMRGADGKFYHYILPSFFYLIHHLCSRRSEQDFRIVFRTYGLDASNVLKAVSAMLGGQHPLFPRTAAYCGISVDPTPAHLYRSDGEMVLEGGDWRVEGERAIFEALSTGESDVCAVVDDFHWWMSHRYSHLAGKPLWLEPSEAGPHHVFFDDNIRVGEEDSIVDVRRLSDSGVQSLPNSLELSGLYRRHLVQVDLLSAIADPQYYVDALERATRGSSNGH